MKKIVSKVLLFTLLANILFTSLFSINTVNAIDADGTASLNLAVSSNLEASNIVGRNFNLNINLKNENSSDGDAYKPGFIITIPEHISFVSSAGLGSPSKTLNHSNGSTILFFKTSDIIIKGDSNNYTLTLKSNDNVGLFSSKDIKVTAYAEDNIYGRGAVASGAPTGVLPGGVDLAGSGSVSVDFPDSLTSTGAYSLPYNTKQTKFVPYDIEKKESGEMLIGNEYETTLIIKGNNLGSLKNLHITDQIPKNRQFVGFTQTAGVGNIDIKYNETSSGEVLLDLSNITVAQNTDLEIKYRTLPLAFPIQTYTNSGANILLNTGSVVADETPSPNNIKLLAEGTWNNGTTDINITSPIEKTISPILKYGDFSKSVSKKYPVLGDTIKYTINFTAAENVSYNTGTTITDLLPDGLTYNGNFTTTNTGFLLSSNTTNTDGDTTLVFTLSSSEIKAGSNFSLSYDVLVDGIFQGTGDQNYENLEELVNNASFNGIIKNSGKNENWGFTDPSIIGNSINYTDSESIIGPEPTSSKHIISIKFPDGTNYDYNNPMPAGKGIPAGAEVEFGLSMSFPNLTTIGAEIRDYLPLIMGPNSDIYDVAFQKSNVLRDMSGNLLLMNDNNADGNFDSYFGSGNTLTLSNTGTWIKTEPANTVLFDLGDFTGKRVFSIIFKAKVLPVKPSGYSGEGKLPQKNIAVGSFKNDSGQKSLLSFENALFTLDAPAIEMTKTTTGSNIVHGKNVDYEIEIKNTGASSAYLENILDIIPENMDLVSGSFSAKQKSSPTNLPNSSISQSGTGLTISFDTIGALSRSQVQIDNPNSTTIDESTVIVKYSLAPTKDFIIKENDERKNKIKLDYYSTPDVVGGVYNFGPVESEASFKVGGPTITRTIINTSESGSTLNNLELGEEVEFETKITLPGGTYTNTSFREILNPRLEFLTGTIISYSPNLTFSSGTTFIGNNVDFGTILNDNSDLSTPETIVIQTKARVKKTASKANNVAATGRFTYTDGLLKQINTPVNVIVPELNITKNSGANNVEVGDEITYTINISHTSNSNANAYDIILKDTLASNLAYKTGSLSGNSSFSGTEFDLFSASGLKLENLNLGDSETLTYKAIVKNTAIAGENEQNTASIAYTSLDDDISSFERDNFSDSANKTVAVKDISISHEIISTSNPDTNKSKFNINYQDASIGEELTYNLYLNIPKLKINGYKLTQTLPSGIKFLTGSIITDGVVSHTNSNINISPNNIITFDFGNIDNIGGTGTGFILETKVLVENNPANTAGSIKNSNLQALYSSLNKTKTDTNPNFEIVEPNLTIQKDYTPNYGDSGDNIASKIVIRNTGSSKAYDISWSDLFPANTTISGLTNTNFDLNSGDSRTFNFTTTVGNSVSYGGVLTGTGKVNSYKSINPVTSSGKTYSSIYDTDVIYIRGSEEILKKLKTSDKATIGDKVSYELKVKVPETNNQNIKITDKLPLGFAYVTGSLVLDSALTYTGTTTPTITGQDIVWNFASLGNSSNDNVPDYITINYDSVVLDNSNNNSGDTKVEDLEVSYNSGVTILTGSTDSVEIIEPNIALNISKNYTYSDKVNYIFTITNSGSSDAYDLDLKNVFDNSGISLDNGFSITNSGGQVGLTQSGNDFTIQTLAKNSGNPLQFTVTGSVNSSVANNTDIKITGEITYTSQTGTYTSLITNTENRERNGDGGIDDYKTNDDETFRLLLPILDENISVNKIKGDIGEYFEYTITLINTGSVDLSGIGVNLNIPNEFEDFSTGAIVYPSGATNNSTSGTGANLLKIDNIDLDIGETKTITYRVKAKLDTPDLTNINSIANVTNTPQGAIGGTPNVVVKIHAPVLETSINQTDDNLGKVLKDDILTNNFNIKNTGTSTGNTLKVEIDLGDNVSYQSGSLSYSSGSLIDTSTINFDPNTKKLSFTIISLGTSGEEKFTFKTKVIGEANKKIQPKLSVKSARDVQSSSTANELVIQVAFSSTGSVTSGSSGFLPTCSNNSLVCSGGVWKIKSGYSCLSPKIGKTCEIKKEEKEEEKIKDKKEDEPKLEKIENKKKDENKIEKINKDELNNFLKSYEEKLKIIEKLRKEKFESGKSGLRGLPKLLPQTGTPIYDRVKKLNNDKIETSLPSDKVFRLAGNKNYELNHWLQVLEEKDRNSNNYIVLPSNGLVIPVNNMKKGTDDYESLISGYEVDINKHLKNGALEYPETSKNDYGEVGNKVIFGHSSYWKNDDGRYKTHFQKIIELNRDEEVWVYKKDENGEYRRFRYFVEKSYNTTANDTSVLKPGVGKNLTLITCTPIGGIATRWIIKAKFIDEYLEELENEFYFKNLSTKNKKIAEKLVEKISKMENKKQVLYKVYNKVNVLLDDEKYSKVKTLLTYIKYKTALEIKKIW